MRSPVSKGRFLPLQPETPAQTGEDSWRVICLSGHEETGVLRPI